MRLFWPPGTPVAHTQCRVHTDTTCDNSPIIHVPDFPKPVMTYPSLVPRLHPNFWNEATISHKWPTTGGVGGLSLRTRPSENQKEDLGSTVVCKSLVSKSTVVIQHWPIRTITNDITSILIGHLQIFNFCSLTKDLQTTVGWGGSVPCARNAGVLPIGSWLHSCVHLLETQTATR